MFREFHRAVLQLVVRAGNLRLRSVGFPAKVLRDEVDQMHHILAYSLIPLLVIDLYVVFARG